MTSTHIHNLNLYHEVTGDGPPLVLLHGLGSSGADWGLQVPAFAERYQVITVDLRGHGRSLDGAGSTSVAQMAEDVAGLLGRLGIEPAHVVGLSLGGCVAQPLAVRYPERVRSLVLVNTFARLRPVGLAGAGRLVQRMWLFGTAPMPALAEFVARGLFPKPEQRALYTEAVVRLSRNSKGPYLRAMMAVASFDARLVLSAIHCPTLIVAGDRDNTVPRYSVEELRRGIAGARFALIEDSGHATPIDQPQEFNRVVLEFVGAVG